MECGPSSARVVRPAVCGLGIGGESASVVVDVCVATHMRGLVPHDHPQAYISWTRATGGCSGSCTSVSTAIPTPRSRRYRRTGRTLTYLDYRPDRLTAAGGSSSRRR